MEKIYKSILEIVELKGKESELDRIIKEDIKEKSRKNKEILTMDDESVEYKVELREQEALENKIQNTKNEKEKVQEVKTKKIQEVQGSLQEKVNEVKKQLEENENVYREKVLENIENAKKDEQENEVEDMWNTFYGTKESDELKKNLAAVEERSSEFLHTIKNLEGLGKEVTELDNLNDKKLNDFKNKIATELKKIAPQKEKVEEENTDYESMWDAFYENQTKSDSGKDESGKDESGKDESGKDESGKDESGKDESGKDESGKDESGKDESGKDESGKDESGKDESGKDESGKDETKKTDPEEARKKEIRDNSQKVRIAYSAKDNVFLIENRNGQYKPFRKTMEEINAISLEELAKKMGKEEKDFENIGEGTILMLKVLSCYDEKFYTNKAEECLNLQGEYKVKSSERNEKMNKKGINIEINLKGLYAKEKRISKYTDRDKKISDEDREAALAVAKDMKETGTGTLKGITTKLINATGKTGEKIADSKIVEIASNLGKMASNIFSNIKGKVKLPKVKLPKLLKSPKENTKAQEADIEEKVAQAAAKMLDDEKKQKEESKDPGKKLGVKAKSNEEAAREEAAAKAAAKMLDDEKQQQEGQR